MDSKDFIITTDKTRLDLEVIHGFLTASYWSEGISKDFVKKAIENSLCFGVFKEDRQVGFARVISDFTTFAYLCDVFILKEFRRLGLSKQLMGEVMQHPDLRGLRRFTLATRDAHDLYKKFGFTELQNPGRFMEINKPGIYRSGP